MGGAARLTQQRQHVAQLLEACEDGRPAIRGNIEPSAFGENVELKAERCFVEDFSHDPLALLPVSRALLARVLDGQSQVMVGDLQGRRQTGSGACMDIG